MSEGGRVGRGFHRCVMAKVEVSKGGGQGGFENFAKYNEVGEANESVQM